MSGSLSIVAAVRVDSTFLDTPAQRAGFVLLGMFLLSFLFIRTSARLIRSPKVTWWPGSVKTASGLHLHHVVWGIFLLLISGFLGFVIPTKSPETEILGGIFGVGAGLTMDEFALWIYLDDVYWAEEGRTSFRAVVVVLLLGGLVLTGAAPFSDDTGTSLGGFVVLVAIDVAFAGLTIIKGKPLVALFGLFVPFISLVAAIRLARPSSIWARRFYAPDGRKRKRAQTRWARIEGRRRRASDWIAGAPGIPDISHRAADVESPATVKQVGDE